MSRMVALLRKEALDLVKHRMVLVTLLLVPSLLTLVALGSVVPLQALPQGEVSMDELGPLAASVDCTDLAPEDCLRLSVAAMHRLLYLIIPTTLPTVIAAYSVVGEKSERTLEALLATPISTTELLSAKGLAALIPAVVATWLAAAVHAAGLFAAVGPDLLARVYTPAWLAALVATVPTLALASVLLSLLVSSRSVDPRSAQQLGGFVVVPIVGMLIAQSLGVGVLRAPVLAALTIGAAAIDALLMWLCVQVFERESILVRWKGM
ncbi:MAG: ABC transporter permease subunit [Alphaproteobacteria bacterium]|nr:ABC transporter permease subunit [Alphaproteobacteria bacterium]